MHAQRHAPAVGQPGRGKAALSPAEGPGGSGGAETYGIVVVPGAGGGLCLVVGVVGGDPESQVGMVPSAIHPSTGDKSDSAGQHRQLAPR